MIVVYTDGSGHARGGVGGVGWCCPELDLEGSLTLPAATNQQAEILAAAFALHELVALVKIADLDAPPDRVPYEVRIVSDSRYVVDGWDRLPRWITDGWRTASGRPCANRPQWERLISAASVWLGVTFGWVKGHDGTPGNERADRLASAARRGGRPARRINP